MNLRHKCLFHALCCGLVLTVLAVRPSVVRAQDDAAEDAPAAPLVPLAVVNVAGVERLLTDVNAMFKSIDREDMNDVIKGLLEQVRDLKGLDRKKPLGMMLFLKPGLTPFPVPVTYIPVDNINDLVKTATFGPVSPRKVPGEENRYELVGGRQTIQALIRDGYALVANDEEILDENLPSPMTYANRLTARYDLALSINVKAIPEGMRTIFLDFLRAQTEAELQQRDDEPDARFKARKAAGMSNLENLENLLQYGDSFVLGVDASAKTKAIVIEAEIKATPDSKFAKELTDVRGKTTAFVNALSDQIPLAVSVSWKINKDDAEVMGELIEAGESALTERLKETDVDPRIVEKMFKSFKSTVDSQHIDFFMQFRGEPPGKFVMVGGLKIDRDKDLADGMGSLLGHFKDAPELESLTVNAAAHQNVQFHRLQAAQQDRGSERTFGKGAGFYMGAGMGALWFAAGGEDALPVLKTVMDKVAARTVVTEDKERPPFRMVMNVSSWLGLTDDGDADRPRPFRETAKQAFEKGQDKMEISAQPTENGLRFRIRLDEGFIRLLGMGITRQYDRRGQRGF